MLLSNLSRSLIRIPSFFRLWWKPYFNQMISSVAFCIIPVWLHLISLPPFPWSSTSFRDPYNGLESPQGFETCYSHCLHNILPKPLLSLWLRLSLAVSSSRLSLIFPGFPGVVKTPWIERTPLWIHRAPRASPPKISNYKCDVCFTNMFANIFPEPGKISST